MARNWMQMTSEEKMAMLTAILERAATDRGVRERLLDSPESALTVLRELNQASGDEVVFPPDFSIRFLPPETTAKPTNTLILRVPEYYPNAAPPLNLDEHLICTYNYWIDIAPEGE